MDIKMRNARIRRTLEWAPGEFQLLEDYSGSV